MNYSRPSSKDHAFKLIIAILSVILVVAISGCNSIHQSQLPMQPIEEGLSLPPLPEQGSEQPSEHVIIPEDEPSVEEIPAPYTHEATLIAVGDIMMHSPQIPAGFDPVTQTYSYDSFFSEVQGILSSGDWVIGNLETPLAGEEAGYSGFPEFNAPAELADALKYAGFNILTTANNHALDRREQGVLRTLDNIHAREILTTGTAASEDEAMRTLIVTKNEISMAILAYTYGTNGIPIPDGKDYLVSLIDEDKMIADIVRAREQGADVITIALHFGDEYKRQPNEYQVGLATKLIQAGADLILGSHPHVVQPYEFIETEASDGTKREGLVIYSLGNFISNQNRSNTPGPTEIGVILSVKIQKHFPEGQVQWSDVETTPTYVHRYRNNDKSQYRVLPLESVIAAKNDPLLLEQDYPTLEVYLAEMKQHLESLTVPVSQ